MQMTITVIENVIMILGWSVFWISLAVYGGTVSSRGFGEGRAILVLSIVASLIHSIVLFGILAGVAFSFLGLRKKINAHG